MIQQQASTWQTGASQTSSGRFRQRALLLICFGVVGIVWGVMLPALAKKPHFKDRIEWLQQKRIDPNAMYYTDLEVMEDILARAQCNQRDQRESRIQK